MRVERRVTGGEALTGFIRLARASRLTADEHDQFALWASVIKAELDAGEKIEQELEQLKAEHAKCTGKPDSTNSVVGSVGSE